MSDIKTRIQDTVVEILELYWDDANEDALQYALDFDLGVINLDEDGWDLETIKQRIRELDDDSLLEVYDYLNTDYFTQAVEAV
jgi:hypothetical protein